MLDLTQAMLSQKKQPPISLNYLENQEPEDDTREEEAARQKEFLEKVVISQKGQLRQLEKVGNISVNIRPLPMLRCRS